MPASKMKPLTLAKSMTELNDKAEKVEVNIKFERECLSYCNTINDIFKKARAKQIDQDEEWAYFYYMRYFHVLQKFKLTFYYKKSKAKYDALLKSSDPFKAITEAEILAKSLKKRYEKVSLQNDVIPILPDVPDSLNMVAKDSPKPKVNDVNNANKGQTKAPDAKVGPSTNGNDSTHKGEPLKPNGDTTHSNGMTAKKIEVMDLYKLTKSAEPGGILIIDVRQQHNYASSSIKTNAISINIPQSLLVSGATLNSIDRRLTKEVFDIWITRSQKDHIILIDNDSKDFQARSPVMVLNDILIKANPQNSLKSAPNILHGGFDQWHVMFPSLCTNPLYSTRKKPTQSKDAIPYLAALSSYPSLSISKRNNTPDNRLNNNNNEQPHREATKEVSATSADTYANQNGSHQTKTKSVASNVTPSSPVVNPKPTNNTLIKDTNKSTAINSFVDTTILDATDNASPVPQPQNHKLKNTVKTEPFSLPSTNHPTNKSVASKPDMHESSMNGGKTTTKTEITKPNPSQGTPSVPQINQNTVKQTTKNNSRINVAQPLDPMPKQQQQRPNEAAKPVNIIPDISKPANIIPVNETPSIQPMQPSKIPTPKQPKIEPQPSKPTLKPSTSKTDSTLKPSIQSHGLLEAANGIDQVTVASKNILPTVKTTPGFPTGWEMVNEPNSRVFYKDHNKQETHWHLPPGIAAQVRNQSSTTTSAQTNFKSQEPPATKGLRTSSASTDTPRSSMTRSRSTPNLAADLENNILPPSEQHPVVDRSIKPQEQKRVAVDRSRKPISETRMQNLMPVHGSKGQFLTGLKNLGNTCYMNSIVQCLSATIPLSDYFVSGGFEVDINKNKKSSGFVPRELSFLLKVLWSGQYRSVSPYDFRHMIGYLRSDFGTSQQQDAHELLIILLDQLHRDLGRNMPLPANEDTDNLPDEVAANKAWTVDVFNKNNFLVNVFQGQFCSSVCCLTCNHKSVTFESFSFLQLELPSKSSCSLEDCIRSFTKTEKISGKDSWKCSKCKQYREAAKTIQIWRLPPILIIQLKRFSSDGIWHNKLQTNVQFPFHNLQIQCCKKGSDTGTYNLYSVVNHYGSFECGHYTAYCSVASSGRWYCFDDVVVRELDTSSVRTAAAYVLFYSSIALKPQ